MRRPAQRARTVAGEGGFTYLGLLFAVVILGITLATVGVVWSTQIRREKEVELLFAGAQIRDAIGRYYAEAPTGAHLFPPTLADLVEDHRWPEPHRHLRRLYYDPITATQDWQLILGPNGGIMGVASKSLERPIKRANFSDADAAFENAETYADWQFIYVNRTLRRTPGAAATPPIHR